MMTLACELAGAIANKISEAATEFTLTPVLILDVGVFPWHESIELSLLCDGDGEDDSDIAGWPLYNFSRLQEGEWKTAEPLCSQLKQEWEKAHNILPILQIVATAMTTEVVQQAIQQLPQTPTFRIQILNPDDPDSPNYFV